MESHWVKEVASLLEVVLRLFKNNHINSETPKLSSLFGVSAEAVTPSTSVICNLINMAAEQWHCLLYPHA